MIRTFYTPKGSAMHFSLRIILIFAATLIGVNVAHGACIKIGGITYCGPGPVNSNSTIVKTIKDLTI